MWRRTGHGMPCPDYTVSIFPGRLLPAIRANVHIVAKFHLAHADFRLGVKSEALAIHDEAHVRADFAVGPQIKRFLDDQIPDAIVALDETRDFGGGFRSGDVFFGLRGRRE